MSRVLTKIAQIQGTVVANIGRSYPLIRSQGGPGVGSTGREAGATALPFGSHPKALSPQCLWNLLRLRQGTPKMDYSCQNPHGVPQGFRQANCLAWRLRDRQASGLPWAEGWRSCQMRGRSAVLRCLRRVRRSEEQGPRLWGCDAEQARLHGWASPRCRVRRAIPENPARGHVGFNQGGKIVSDPIYSYIRGFYRKLTFC